MSGTISRYGVASLWEPAVLLPSQLLDRGACSRSPEMRLLLAVVEDAFQCIVRNADAYNGPRWREFLEAYSWFLDDSRGWPFAFANVCDMLALDAEAIRESLQRIIARRRKVVDDPLPLLLRECRLNPSRVAAEIRMLGRKRRQAPGEASRATGNAA